MLVKSQVELLGQEVQVSATLGHVRIALGVMLCSDASCLGNLGGKLCKGQVLC